MDDRPLNEAPAGGGRATLWLWLILGGGLLLLLSWLFRFPWG
jgi:hypothetical protein